MKKTLDLSTVVTPDNLAQQISNKWFEWDSLRQGWKQEKRELRNYVFATDTRTTSNAKLPWSNSTTTPKLCQIYDNLKANYSAALFPQDRWMKWEGNDRDGVSKQKAKIIEAYLYDKIRNSDFMKVADRLLDDYILCGNCFGTVSYEIDVVDIEDSVVLAYMGPKLVRVSPYDIVFDPTAASFSETPKIIRSIVTLGTARKMVGDEAFEKMLFARREVGSSTTVDKADGYIADGFSSIEHYYGSGYVEILTFYGDIYDIYEGTYKESAKITIADRAYIVSDEKIASWLGRAPVFHAGWRSRPDNLYAMGPLDNLVGMQYRIDHLENLRADVMDQIALPMLKIKGEVEDFDYHPGERIFMGEEGDVGFLNPDATALQADFQISTLENKMEELAGAPRQAMGIRTPGEKTAFEVQTLQSSSSRIFEHKAAKFEQEFVEPVLNAMLEAGRRNIDTNDLIRVFDSELGIFLFESVSREDIQAKGKIRPVGARHFAEKARRVQNLQALQIAKQDPSVAVHLSGKVTAEILSEELGEPRLFGDNIAIEEQLETQQKTQDAEVENVDRLAVQEELGV